MPPELSHEEVRVLGSLIEKEATTPQQYPLSLNALVLACNQASNRDPVVDYSEDTVEQALNGLREKKLARLLHPTHGRGVTKYRHVAHETLALGPPELAVLAVLLLRGPQTLGELRARTERLHPFESVAEVQDALDRLGEHEEHLVVRLERQPGQKEARFAHLLAGEPAQQVAPRGGWREEEPATDDGAPRPLSTAERIASLEDEVRRLRADLDALAHELGISPAGESSGHGDAGGEGAGAGPQGDAPGGDGERLPG